MKRLIQQLLSRFCKPSPEDERQRAMTTLRLTDNDLKALQWIRQQQRRGMFPSKTGNDLAKLTFEGFEALGGSSTVYAKKPKELLKYLRAFLNQKELPPYDYRKVYALLAAYGRGRHCSFPYLRNPVYKVIPTGQHKTAD